MSNARRPSLEKKQTPKTRKAREDALNQGISIVVDGTTYTVRSGDLSSLDTLALRRTVGLSFAGVIRAMQSDPDIDLIAAIVWLARRVDGERGLEFEDVASEIGYDVDLDVLEDAEESEPGEA